MTQPELVLEAVRLREQAKTIRENMGKVLHELIAARAAIVQPRSGQRRRGRNRAEEMPKTPERSSPGG